MKRFVGAVLSALFGVLLFTTLAGAAEVKGTVKSVDGGKNVITLTVDGKSVDYKVEKDASITSVSIVKGKKAGKDMEKVTTIETLAGIKAGAKVTLLTDTVDAKETVKSIKVDGGIEMKTKKKKAN